MSAFIVACFNFLWCMFVVSIFQDDEELLQRFTQTA